MDERKRSYVWAPLEDLPPEWEALSSLELRGLSSVWRDQRDRLLRTNAEALERFNKELSRQWSIETGILEGLYNLDRGITQLLIERGIDAALISTFDTNRSPEVVAAIIQDHEDTIEGLFDFVKGTRTLSTGYVKELHASLVRHQPFHEGVDVHGKVVWIPLEAGVYKLRPNNPHRSDGSVHEYCPPEQVTSEMDRLITLHQGHVGVSPEVESAWLHHRFTQIHPFVDGNGRVARCLGTLVFLKDGAFPLVVTRDEREEYIEGLETADRGDLRPLVQLFVRLQRRAFLRALTISEKVLSHGRVTSVIDALRDELMRKRQEQQQEFLQAREICRVLLGVARQRFTEVRLQLDELGDVLGKHDFFVDADDGARAHYHHFQIITVARRLGYFANFSDFHVWVRLALKTDQKCEIIVSFHDLGHVFRGLCAVSACFFRRESTGEGESGVLDVTPLTDDIFQVNYMEQAEEAENRFIPWLEGVLLRGLEIWRRII